MLTSAFRNSPVGVHTQVKLICRPSNVMNRTGGCFLKHTSGWIFMKQNRLFVRFFMFDHYLILIIFVSPVFLFVPIQSSMIFGGPSDLKRPGNDGIEPTNSWHGV